MAIHAGYVYLLLFDITIHTLNKEIPATVALLFSYSTQLCIAMLLE